MCEFEWAFAHQIHHVHAHARVARLRHRLRVGVFGVRLVEVAKADALAEWQDHALALGDDVVVERILLLAVVVLAAERVDRTAGPANQQWHVSGAESNPCAI